MSYFQFSLTLLPLLLALFLICALILPLLFAILYTLYAFYLLCSLHCFPFHFFYDSPLCNSKTTYFYTVYERVLNYNRANIVTVLHRRRKCKLEPRALAERALASTGQENGGLQNPQRRAPQESTRIASSVCAKTCIRNTPPLTRETSP